jgi:mannose-6-phosphate isomerase
MRTPAGKGGQIGAVYIGGSLPRQLAMGCDVATGEDRPWGRFEVLDEGPGFKVKRITVQPGGRLSLQSHAFRAEHWTVISGTATVTVGEHVTAMTRAQSIDIPLGARHRLENLHEGVLDIIEVQFGDDLGEDDIIRYDDAYART